MSDSSRPGSSRMAADPDGERLPIGVCIRSIRAEPGWWLESARRLDQAGYAGLWSWDHFMGRDDRTVPVVEAWTILSMAAAQTSRATGDAIRSRRTGSTTERTSGR